MRYFYSLIVGTSLALAPAVSFAGPVTMPRTAQPHSLSVPAGHSQPTTSAAPAPAPSVGPKTTSDDARYAALDAASPDAKDYRAGDTIVIGASAGAVILAVVLLVVLL
jgi:hypothetical protein